MNEPGIFVESLAGAGGAGGEGLSTILGNATGGDGGVGGTGGAVEVDIIAGSQSITTSGDGATGIHGGAGGDGGPANGFIPVDSKGGAGQGSGPGGSVTVTYGGEITTDGDTSDAILAQSVGVFSGNAVSASGFVSYGASGQSGGGGGVVVTYSGGSEDTITTKGNDSDGIFNQSVGGGAGKHVTVTSSVPISTLRSDATGILAQSLGGGGSATSTTGLDAIGGKGGSGAIGGDVTVTAEAGITTVGDNSEAIFAQSVGDSGGKASSAFAGAPVFALAISGSGGKGNDGAAVSVSTTSDTLLGTQGKGANGLFAQRFAVGTVAGIDPTQNGGCCRRCDRTINETTRM